MRRSLLLLAMLLMLGNGKARAEDEGPGSVVLSASQPLTFPAELGTDDSILGMGFEKNLRELDANGETHRVYPAKSVEVAVNKYDVKVELVDNSLSFEANGRYLFLDAGIKASAAKRYLILRAYHIDKIVKLAASGKPEGNAPMYASKILYGWSLYVIVEGSASSFTSDVAAGLRSIGAGADFKAAVDKHKLQTHVQAFGLKPSEEGKLVVATNKDEVLAAFSPDESVPIFVEYTLTSDLEVDAIPWEQQTFKPGRYTIDLDATLMPTNGSGKKWDSGDKPDPNITLYVNGEKFKSCRDGASLTSSCFRDVAIDIDANTELQFEIWDYDGEWEKDDYCGASEPFKVMSFGGVPGVPLILKTTGQLKTASATLKPVD